MIDLINASKRVKDALCDEESVSIKSKQSGVINPDEDYYLENGLLVFTAAYHLKRGNCCRSGCRHCPYGYRKKQ
jgi:Family of unknown function (DUF5522)